MSIVNKNFKPKERDANRLRLGKVLKSPDIDKMITFVIYSDKYEHKSLINKNVPSVNYSNDTSGTNWKIKYPDEKQDFWSFTEFVDTLF